MNAPSPADSIPKVLVVDDNPIIQRAVYFSLRDHGVKVIMCGDVTDSLHMIRLELPVLVVLDINFPCDPFASGVRDGFWALEWMRHVKDVAEIPVVMISSEDATKARPRALAAGALKFLQKPLDKAELIAIVRAVIDQKTARLTV